MINQFLVRNKAAKRIYKNDFLKFPIEMPDLLWFEPLTITSIKWIACLTHFYDIKIQQYYDYYRFRLK